MSDKKQYTTGKYNVKKNKNNQKFVYSKQDAHKQYREYKSYYNTNSIYRKYDKHEIRRFLERPYYYEERITDVSLYLASTSSHYLRLVYYLSSMLTLDHILVPNGSNFKNDNEILKSMNKANLYINRFNIKHELAKIIPTIIIEDVFFGYESAVNGTSTIRKLPSKYCKIVGIEDGLYVFTFNFAYFDYNKHLLKDYPKEFRNLYDTYKSTGVREQELDPNLGAICFKFRDDLTYNFPFFAPLFEDLAELAEKKDIADNNELLNNYKLLLQKIPLKKDARNESDMIFTPDTTKIFHNNLVEAVPNRVGVVTSPMDIEQVSLTGNTNLERTNLSDAQEELFTAAGYGNIFSSKNSGEGAFKYSNTSDQSVMFKLLRQFERFFNARLKRELGGHKKINIIFPDITYFNRKQATEEYLKLAQFGYPKSLVAIASGMSQSQFLGLNKLESILEIENKLIPLSSTHTQSGSGDIGRPQNQE